MDKILREKARSNASRVDMSTEQKILSAARAEFCAHGLDGGRMQAIADRAGVNKALLHYYFRSKEKLFELIIQELVSDIWNTIHGELNANAKSTDLRTIIRTLVSAYINAFSRQPEIPRILIHQLLHRDKNVPLIVRHIIRAIGDGPKKILVRFEKESRSGRIRRVDPVQLMMSIMGMIMITFLSQPIIDVVQQQTGFSVAYDERFFKTRIQFITDMVFDGIQTKERQS
jgi:TetR/AcrR family transcriptional regulator